MLSNYSLGSIFSGQVKTVRKADSRLASAWCLFFFFAAPAISPVIQYKLKLHLDKDLVSIIISAASIFAGLLLNLLVIVYGIIPSKEGGDFDDKTRKDLLEVIESTFYNISYAIACSLVLVVFSLAVLTEITTVTRISELFVYYLGAHLLLCITLVLRRCHSLMEFRLTKKGTTRAQIAQDTWGR